VYICGPIYRSVDEKPSQLTVAANRARQEDSASLKSKILEYILPDPNSDTLEPALPGSSGKSSRGFNHPITAYHLCPIDWMGDYKDHIEYVLLAFPSGDYSQNDL
jgi:hypothetical protein